MAGYTYLWEFHVRPEKQADFERIYGPRGKWVALFRQAPGYVGTLLLKDDSTPGRYLTIDRWENEQAYRDFRTRFSQAYQTLDDECQGLTINEVSLGAYSDF